MTKKLPLFVLLVCLFILSASAQDKKPPKSPPPGGIKLLNGYVHIKGQGIDTWVGRSKKNSLFSDEPRSKLTGHSPENFRPKRRNHEF